MRKWVREAEARLAMTDLGNGTLESIRRGLHAILEMDALPPPVKEVVQRLLALLEDESRTPEDIEKALEKMLRRAPTTPEAAAKQLVEKNRESARRRRRPLGRPAGRGAPREKSENDPKLRAAAVELLKKIREGAERRRRPGGRV